MIRNDLPRIRIPLKRILSSDKRVEDLTMDAEFFWSLFLETGAPECYLLYKREKEKPQEKTA